MRRAVFLMLAFVGASAATRAAFAQTFEPVRDAAVQLGFEERDDFADWPSSPRPQPHQVRPVSGESSDIATPRSAERATRRASAGSHAPRAITPRSEEGMPSAGGRGASAWTTLFALSAVVGLIFVVARWWRRHGPPPPRSLPNEVFEALGRTRLDPRRSVELFRIGGKILVVGSAGDGLRTLAEIDDPSEVDRLAGACRKSESGDFFAGRLRLLLGGRSTDETEAVDDEAAIAEFNQRVAPITASDLERAEAGHG